MFLRYSTKDKPDACYGHKWRDTGLNSKSRALHYFPTSLKLFLITQASFFNKRYLAVCPSILRIPMVAGIPSWYLRYLKIPSLIQATAKSVFSMCGKLECKYSKIGVKLISELQENMIDKRKATGFTYRYTCYPYTNTEQTPFSLQSKRSDTTLTQIQAKFSSQAKAPCKYFPKLLYLRETQFQEQPISHKFNILFHQRTIHSNQPHR